MKREKRIIFIGNPMPNDMVGLSNVLNITIADNIAQNTLIEGIYRHYSKEVSVISISARKHTRTIDLGYGIEAKTVYGNPKNRAIFYLSIMKNYTIRLFQILKEDYREGTIIITSGPYIYIAAPVILAKLRYKIKWVTFLIGAVEVPEEKFPYSIASKLSKWTVKKVDGVITYVKNSVVDYMPGKPFVEISFLINEQMMDIYRNYGAEKNKKFTISYTGALNDIYNVGMIVDTIKMSGKKYHWVFAGTGKYAEALENLSKDPGFDVDYLGTISNLEAAKLQKTSHLLLCLKGETTLKHSQYYGRYTASGKLIEYMCSGTPVFVSDVDSYSSKVKSFMTYEKDLSPNKIEKIIGKIKADYKDRVKKAHSGQRYAFQHFNSTYQNKKIHEFLDEL